MAVQLERFHFERRQDGDFDVTFLLRLDEAHLGYRERLVSVTIVKADGEGAGAFATRVKPILQAAVDARRAEMAATIAARTASESRRAALQAGAENLVGTLA